MSHIQVSDKMLRLCIALDIGIPDLFAAFIRSPAVEDAVYALLYASYRGVDFSRPACWRDARAAVVTRHDGSGVKAASVEDEDAGARDILVAYFHAMDDAARLGAGFGALESALGPPVWRFRVFFRVLEHYLEDPSVEWAWKRYHGSQTEEKDGFWIHWTKQPFFEDPAWDSAVERFGAAVKAVRTEMGTLRYMFTCV